MVKLFSLKICSCVSQIMYTVHTALQCYYLFIIRVLCSAWGKHKGIDEKYGKINRTSNKLLLFHPPLTIIIINFMDISWRIQTKVLFDTGELMEHYYKSPNMHVKDRLKQNFEGKAINSNVWCLVLYSVLGML